MPEYAVFIWEDERAWEQAGPQQSAATMQAHQEFAAANPAALRGGSRLYPSAASTSIRTGPDGAVTITDAAFAETKEVIGGYYVIEAADLDEALRIAAQVPAPFGGVEVRPVMAMG